jgi:hypothetical protein
MVVAQRSASRRVGKAGGARRVSRLVHLDMKVSAAVLLRAHGWWPCRRLPCLRVCHKWATDVGPTYKSLIDTGATESNSDASP